MGSHFCENFLVPVWAFKGELCEFSFSQGPSLTLSGLARHLVSLLETHVSYWNFVPLGYFRLFFCIVLKFK